MFVRIVSLLSVVLFAVCVLGVALAWITDPKKDWVGHLFVLGLMVLGLTSSLGWWWNYELHRRDAVRREHRWWP